MEQDLEIENFESVLHLRLPAPNKKLNVLIMGEQTRLACRIIPNQCTENIQTSCPFIQYEQGTPLKPSSFVFYKHFISTSGDKLEACLKIIECPQNTTLAVTRDPTVFREVLDYGSKADVILVSVSQDDKKDFENTRLSKIL